MELEVLLLICRTLAAVVFIGTVIAGYHLHKNSAKYFGAEREHPGDGESALALNKVQVYSIWAHVLLASGAFALLAH